MELAHVLQMSLLGALRTGNPIIDMLLGTVVASAVMWLLSSARTYVWPKLNTLHMWKRGYVYRTIDETYDTKYASRPVEATLLRTAIDTYVTAHIKNVSQCNVNVLFSNSGPQIDDYINREVCKAFYNIPWTAVGPGVELMTTRNERLLSSTDSSTRISRTYTLRARTSTEVDNFLERVWTDHRARMTKNKIDRNRYVYDLFFTSSEKGQPEKTSQTSQMNITVPAQRFVIATNKTFDTMFFQGKADVMRVLNDFKNKTGAFGMPGRSHKLGVLVHGPPGTGKTSIAKAIAAYMGRSIVHVRLSEVRTNVQFFNLMYDLHVSLPHGEANTLRLAHDKTVLLLEEIDVCAATAPRKAAYESTAETDDNDADSKKSSDTSVKLEKPGRGDKQLDLSGVLTGLDGALDAPGRIVVMTTNHVEKLDTAIRRAGRADIELYMGPIDADMAVEMINVLMPHWVLSEHQCDCFRAAVRAASISPARLEQLCKQHFSGTIDNFIANIKPA